MNIDSDKLLEWFRDYIRHAAADTYAVSDHQRELLDIVFEELQDAIHSGELAAKRECVLDGLSDEDAEIVRNAIKNEALRLRKQIEAENNGCPNFCTGGIIYQGRHSYPCPNCTAA